MADTMLPLGEITDIAGCLFFFSAFALLLGWFIMLLCYEPLSRHTYGKTGTNAFRQTRQVHQLPN